MTFNGGTEVPTFTDNLEGLRMDNTSYTQVYQNKFTHYREANNFINTSAVKTYHNDHLIFKNNEIDDCTIGIYLKSLTFDSEVVYNYIHDNYFGILNAIYLNTVNEDRVKFHDNVFANNSYAHMGADINRDDSHADDWEIYNNTFYGSLRGIGWLRTSTPAHGAKIYNNIIQGSANLQLVGLFASGLVEEDYNQWGTSSLTFIIRLYNGNTINYNSLATWQASTELASGGHPGTGDLASDPKFVNSSGHFNQLTDFKLAGNSPCKGTGKGGVDMGANIDLVGVGNSTEQERPAHPKNLQ